MTVLTAGLEGYRTSTKTCYISVLALSLHSFPMRGAAYRRRGSASLSLSHKTPSVLLTLTVLAYAES